MSRTRQIFVGILLFVAMAFVTQWLFIKYVPNIIYRIAVHRSGKPANTWINAPKTNDQLRRVVLPNPDFVYSALFYDVSEKDIVISGNFPDSVYASVAFYDERCQPFYVYNNMSYRRKGTFLFQLSMWGLKGDNQLQAATKKGVIICRFLMPNDSSYARLATYQQVLSCKVK